MIIGPHFFEGPDKNAVAEPGKPYREMLVNFSQPDGATAHMARATMQILTVMFQD